MKSEKKELIKQNNESGLLRLGSFLISAPFLAAFISVCILTAALIFEPVIGLADNGDFYRSITSSGLYKLDRYESDQYFSYASTVFGKFKYFNEYSTGFSSSQSLFINLAVLLDSIFTSDADRFDIRFLGAIMILLYAAVQYLLVDSLTYKARPLAKYIICAISIYFFTDIGYTSYFNSFYAEGIVLCTFLLSMTSLVMLVEKRHSPILMTIIFILSSLILITSKQQNAPLGVFYAIAVLFIPFLRKRSKGRPDSALAANIMRKLAIPLALMLCFSGIAVYLMISQVYVHTNSYHAMTRGILLTSSDPEKTLEEFNINPQYSLLSGTTFYDDTPVIDVESDLMVESFYNRYGFVSIATYYLTHPNSLVQMLNLAIKNAWKIRPLMDGNYDRSAGFTAGKQTTFFSLHSSFLSTYIPRSFGFVIIWLAACLFINRKHLGRILAIVTSFIMGLSQILVSIIGAGDADIGKHIFLFDVSYDYITLISFAAILIWLTGYISNNKNTPAAPKKIKKTETDNNSSASPAARIMPSSIISKFAIIITALLICTIAYPDSVKAEGYTPSNSSNSSSEIMIVSRNDSDEALINNLVNAFGESAYEVSYYNYTEIPDTIKYVITTEPEIADDARAAGIKPFCIGDSFLSENNIKIITLSNVGITSDYDGQRDYSGFFDKISLIDSSDKVFIKTFGAILTSSGDTYPFCVSNSDAWYVPWYKENDLSSIMLSSALKLYTDSNRDGQMYVLLDEVYPFSSFEELKEAGDELYKNGIPFIIRIMPVYTNLDYPSIQRYTQFLRYMQSIGGTVVIHDSIIENSDYDPKELEVNLNAFKKILSDQGVYYYPMKNTPLEITSDFIDNISSPERNFGSFPISTMISLNYSNKEIFQKELDSINNSWLTINDYLLLYSTVRHKYDEGTINEDYKYYQEEEKAFSGLMTYGNKVLMIIIIVSLFVYSFIVIVGIRLYNNKFRKRR